MGGEADGIGSPTFSCRIPIVSRKSVTDVPIASESPSVYIDTWMKKYLTGISKKKTAHVCVSGVSERCCCAYRRGASRCWRAR